MAELDKKMRAEKARDYFMAAYESQMTGDMEKAIYYYRRSIEMYPTAEAHTFLGWSYSFQGRITEAITECERAISVDPEFGNPWNDIGAYLIEQGKHREAIPYLEKATQARRYECYHYAHYNLGRACQALGMREKAEEEYRKALQFEPDYPPARDALGALFRPRRDLN